MKKSKLLIPLIPLSVGSLAGIAIPLSSCSCGGGQSSEKITVTIQCDEHCHCSQPTVQTYKGTTWSSVRSSAGISYDDGYDELGAYINGEKIVDVYNYKIEANTTVVVKSCLTSEKVNVSFSASNHCHFQESGFSSSTTYIRSQKFSEVTKPTVVVDEGYSFDNLWFYGKRITDDTTIGELAGSGNYITIRPHIVSSIPTDQSKLSYTVDTEKNTAKITGLTDFSDTHLYIPSTITDAGVTYKVTNINIWYSGSTSIYEVTLPDTLETIDEIDLSSMYKINLPESLTTIGYSAFSGCKALENVKFPSRLAKIGNFAFSGCTSLQSITIPASVTTLGTGAFRGCSSLQSIVVDAANTTYTSRNSSNVECNCIVEISSNTLLQGSATTTIPNTVTTIYNQAFTNLAGLTSITIPASVTSMGEDTSNPNPFEGCSGLKSIQVDSSNTTYSSKGSTDEEEHNYLMKKSGNKIESGCSSTTMPKDASSYTIGTKAFYGVTEGFTTLKFSYAKAYTIEEQAFANCTSLTSIDLLGVYSYEYLGKGAFKGCTNLQTIELGFITQIPEECFSGCENATLTVSFDKLTSIGKDAFKGWKTITSLDITSSSTLTSLTGFNGCPNLTSVTIDSTSLTEIGDYAFYNCSALTSVDFGSNSKVTTIGKCAFSSCKLANLILPRTLTTIDEYAFQSNNELTSIVISESVKTINRSAFSSCSKVASISLPNSLETIGTDAFYGCDEVTAIYVPNSVKTIGSDAFAGMDKLTKAWIGSGVTSMSCNIFSNCPLLTDIKVSPLNSYYTSRSEASATKDVECNYIASKLVDGSKTLYSTCLASSISTDINKIGAYAYSGSEWQSITIPSTITHISDYAVSCYNLKSVTLQATFTEWPSGYSKSAFSSIGSEGTFIAPTSKVSQLVQSNWTTFAEHRWTFNC